MQYVQMQNGRWLFVVLLYLSPRLQSAHSTRLIKQNAVFDNRLNMSSDKNENLSYRRISYNHVVQCQPPEPPILKPPRERSGHEYRSNVWYA
ncbi:hypothetical protein F5B21DRAFT_18331 [Xylaria acuta]|nr:hypothetical protein F5B21DRAFT_18331 [Xylaria acuta]